MKLRKSVVKECRQWLAGWVQNQLDDLKDVSRDNPPILDHPDLPGDISFGEFYETMAQAQWPEKDGRHLSTRRMLLPKDTNPHGHIFGGVILSEIDLAGAIEARLHTKHEVATKYMNGIQFDAPIRMGDVVSIYTTLVKKGNTSLTIKVEVECSRDGSKAPVAVTATEVVYVAIRRLPDGGIARKGLDED